MILKRYLYFLAVVLLLSNDKILAKENCIPDEIGLDKGSTQIEHHFYIGTCHYRNKEYSHAVNNWEKLASIEPRSEEDKGLKVDALNNLGYMKFFGYGTKQEQQKAILYWREAIQLGHYEAEYHLCHAYADIEQATFDPGKARKHCEKAKLLYKGMESKDDDIIASIESYLRKLDTQKGL